MGQESQDLPCYFPYDRTLLLGSWQVSGPAPSTTADYSSAAGIGRIARLPYFFPHPSSSFRGNADPLRTELAIGDEWAA
jgi:hypothetical protein